MTMIVQISARYPGDADAIFASALRFDEMADAMAGLATYAGFPASGTADQGDSFTVDVTFFGFLTVKGHHIHIERIDVPNRIIQSREGAKAVRRWDHELSVQPDGNQVLWTDRVTIDAGWQTPIVARFAAYMYKRRHRFRGALKIDQLVTRD
jgi:hypothetical protein